MQDFEVSVVRRLYQTGKVIVRCGSANTALKIVENRINDMSLKPSDVKWGDVEYGDGYIEVTGGVRQI